MKFGGTPFVQGVVCNAKLILEQLVLVLMARPAQFLEAQAILLFQSCWGKEFFPAKEVLSLHLTRL